MERTIQFEAPTLIILAHVHLLQPPRTENTKIKTTETWNSKQGEVKLQKQGTTILSSLDLDLVSFAIISNWSDLNSRKKSSEINRYIVNILSSTINLIIADIVILT